jgi:hypothetical protein
MLISNIALLDVLLALYLLAMKYFMFDAMPLSLAALIAVGIIVIGCFYLVSPERVSGTFGLKPPASDADTRAWLRLKGIRGPRRWTGRIDHDAARGQALVRHRSTRFSHHPSWRHVNHSGGGRVEGTSVFNSWPNLRRDACRRPFVDPCRLRGV